MNEGKSDREPVTISRVTRYGIAGIAAIMAATITYLDAAADGCINFAKQCLTNEIAEKVEVVAITILEYRDAAVEAIKHVLQNFPDYFG